MHELDTMHIGVCDMKEVSKKQFWGPVSTNKLKKWQKHAPAPLSPWPFALRSLERVHIDFFEFKGKMVLIMIDAFSKYIWAHLMNADTTTMKTLSVLYSWFADRGFPSTLVSDNGPQFTAKEFTEKMSAWGIKHILTPPYHPASLGHRERQHRDITLGPAQRR